MGSSVRYFRNDHGHRVAPRVVGSDRTVRVAAGQVYRATDPDEVDALEVARLTEISEDEAELLDTVVTVEDPNAGPPEGVGTTTTGDVATKGEDAKRDDSTVAEAEAKGYAEDPETGEPVEAAEGNEDEAVQLTQKQRKAVDQLREDADAFKADEVKALAADLDIEGRSNLNKADLVGAILDHADKEAS